VSDFTPSFPELNVFLYIIFPPQAVPQLKTKTVLLIYPSTHLLIYPHSGGKFKAMCRGRVLFQQSLP
jgi:hypothetical protein